MVYIESWDEFAEKAEMLFRAEPLKVSGYQFQQNLKRRWCKHIRENM